VQTAYPNDLPTERAGDDDQERSGTPESEQQRDHSGLDHSNLGYQVRDDQGHAGPRVSVRVVENGPAPSVWTHQGPQASACGPSCARLSSARDTSDLSVVRCDYALLAVLAERVLDGFPTVPGLCGG
jgi:hypothetical protein